MPKDTENDIEEAKTDTNKEMKKDESYPVVKVESEKSEEATLAE
jgi:hypothetical protein